MNKKRTILGKMVDGGGGGGGDDDWTSI